MISTYKEHNEEDERHNVFLDKTDKHNHSKKNLREVVIAE